MATGYYRTMTATPGRTMIWLGGTTVGVLLSLLIFQLVLRAADAFVAVIVSLVLAWVWGAVVTRLHRRWSVLDEVTDQR